MESYEQAVELSLMVVNLDKSIYKTMIRGGLKQYLNSKYPLVAKLNNKNEMDKFILASKILLNDLQAIPVNSCGGRSCSSCMINKCDSSVEYQTPVFKEAIIDPLNVVNSDVTRYIDGYNLNTFDPQISRLSQPLDTIGLYQNKLHEPMMNYESLTGYGPSDKKIYLRQQPHQLHQPEQQHQAHQPQQHQPQRSNGPCAKVRLEEHFQNPTTHPIPDTKKTLYSQYSSVYVNDNGEGYYKNEIINKVNEQNPVIQKTYQQIHKNKFVQ